MERSDINAMKGRWHGKRKSFVAFEHFCDEVLLAKQQKRMFGVDELVDFEMLNVSIPTLS